MYRFFPSVHWSTGYPDRQQIVSQVQQIWKNYGLDHKTYFDTKVEKVYQDDKGRWIINDPSYGRFDGVLPAIGSCGDPKMPSLPEQEIQRRDIPQFRLDWTVSQGQESRNRWRRRLCR